MIISNYYSRILFGKNYWKSSNLSSMPSRGISLNVLRVDRILEGAVGVKEYKNSVNPNVS